MSSSIFRACFACILDYVEHYGSAVLVQGNMYNIENSRIEMTRYRLASLNNTLLHTCVGMASPATNVVYDFIIKENQSKWRGILQPSIGKVKLCGYYNNEKH